MPLLPWTSYQLYSITTTLNSANRSQQSRLRPAEPSIPSSGPTLLATASNSYSCHSSECCSNGSNFRIKKKEAIGVFFSGPDIVDYRGMPDHASSSDGQMQLLDNDLQL